MVDDGGMATQRRADMFIDLDDDPRETEPALRDERAALVESLRCQRLTLEMKCAGLDAEQMARRSVKPSTMSLLGLVRHLAEGERVRRSARCWRDRTDLGTTAPPLTGTVISTARSPTPR